MIKVKGDQKKLKLHTKKSQKGQLGSHERTPVVGNTGNNSGVTVRAAFNTLNNNNNSSHVAQQQKTVLNPFSMRYHNLCAVRNNIDVMIALIVSLRIQRVCAFVLLCTCVGANCRCHIAVYMKRVTTQNTAHTRVAHALSSVY
jgi:hypothetical protein